MTIETTTVVFRRCSETAMIFGDAKHTVNGIIASLKE